MSEYLCRLCGTNNSSENLLKYYEVDFVNEFVSKIFFYFQIDLHKIGNKNFVFCNNCVETVNNITVFYEKIKKAQEKLKNLYGLKVEEIKVEVDNDYTEDKIFIPSKDSFDGNFDKLELENDFHETKPKVKKNKKSGQKKSEQLWKDYEWKCVICTKNLTSLKEYRKHFREVHDTSEIKYLCMDCNKIYEKFRLFKIHVKSHKNKFEFACSFCGKYFFLHRYLLRHEKIHSNEFNFDCDMCDKKFRTKDLLRTHKHTHLPNDLKYTHECQICNKKFSKKTNLIKHTRTLHMGLREFICQECGKNFAQKCNLENHMVTIHSDLTPFHCNICPKVFKTSVSLKNHSKTHTGGRPHECKICQKTFTLKRALTRHETIHTGLLPYQCTHCQKCFRIKENLRVHLRQHTGEKPYSCEDCDKHFTDSSNYIKHMRGKHGVISIAKNILYSHLFNNKIIKASITEQLTDNEMLNRVAPHITEQLQSNSVLEQLQSNNEHQMASSSANSPC